MEALSAVTPAFTPPPSQRAEIARKAEEFEALVLAQLLKPMFESVNTPRLMGGDAPGADAFGVMLNDEYARAIAARGGVGVADQVQAALIRLQSENNSLQGTRS